MAERISDEGIERITMAVPGWLHFTKGMAFRMSALAWFITLVTLTIFVAAIIPEQKRDLEYELKSKASNIASSLLEVTGAAAGADDYSRVVDQCSQLTAGDEAIDHIVISRPDGFSVIVEHDTWRAAHLDESWRPANRKVVSGIGFSPLSGRRVFRFSRPFDRASLELGWIHIGMSLVAYDQSVSRVYWRTGMAAVLAGLLSLLATVVYAQGQVRPILSLQSVVHQVARGDLSARANIRAGDEIADLATSFNRMADSISQRDQILRSVRFAAQQFLGADDWSEAIELVLCEIGSAAKASHAYVFEVQDDPERGTHALLSYEWAAPGLQRSIDVPEMRHIWMGAPHLADAAGQLGSGKVVRLEGEDSGSADPMSRMGRSFLLIPIFAGTEWFGFLGFDDCRGEREWSDAETDSFRAVAGMMGASIARQRAQDDLVEAKATLEDRVAERTKELQDQVTAKELAHAELAETQQRLMALSRMSGMAEVATGVLHNVGNALNSVNVSSTLVAGHIREFRVENLVIVADLLQQHREDLNRFVQCDAKGQRVLPYLSKLGRHFATERRLLLDELELLRSHVAHIKEIVATQQNYSKVSGLIEDICLPELVDDAMRMIQSEFQRNEIMIHRDFEMVPPVPADKHRVLQILLNLLRNALHAVKHGNNQQREIRVRLRCHDDRHVRIEVADNGVGLERENLTRIFAHGFTTKADGHGFGLHSGALAAHEMGGSLWAESDGPGTGATFILELRLTAPILRSKEEGGHAAESDRTESPNPGY